MGFVEWAAKMRKKPIEARRRFVVVWTSVAVIGITVVWSILFFIGVLKDFEQSQADTEARNAVPMTFNEEKPMVPFPEF